MTTNGNRRGGSWSAAPRVLRTAAVVCGCGVVIALAVVLVGWLLVRLAPLTLAVVAALLLTALMGPLAAVFRSCRFPPWLAALGSVIVLLAIVAGPLALIGTQAYAQLEDLQEQLVEGISRIRDVLVGGPLELSEEQVDAVGAVIVDTLQQAAPDPVAGATTVVQTLAAMAIALVLTFFLLRDGHRMWRWVLTLVTPGARERVDDAARAGWDTAVAYIRGTVVVAAVDAVGIGIGLVVLDIPLALPLAFLTFLAAFVPIVGAVLAGAAAVVVALVSNGPTDALLVLAVVIVVQQVESNLLQPYIMGRALRLHPAVVLVSVTAGTLLGGIAGAVVAVPVVAVTYRVADRLRNGDPPAGSPVDPESTSPPDGLAPRQLAPGGTPPGAFPGGPFPTAPGDAPVPQPD